MVFEVSMDFRNALFFLSYLFDEYSTSLIAAMPVLTNAHPSARGGIKPRIVASTRS